VDEPPVRVERDGHVAIATLDDPATLNALSTGMMQALAQLWPRLEADRAVRVVVITGAGQRAFCSGLRAQNIDVDPASRPSAFPRFAPHPGGLRKPTIAAINGVCASGGMGFLTHAAIALASENARFVDTHVSVGQVSGIEAAWLARRIPLGSVTRLLVLGRHGSLDARQALALGLVSEVVPLERLRARALELAHQVASNSPAAIRQSLAALWEGLEHGAEAAAQLAWQRVVEHRSHPDAREGGRAFLEKRAARWQD
jgi:enoyl-CoA hydratase/carnithine racemase